MWKTWLVPARNLLFIVAFSYLSAQILQVPLVSRLKGDVHATEMTPLERRPPSRERDVPLRKSLEDYAGIWERNVFNSTQGAGPETADAQQEPVDQEAEATEMRVLLLGTVTGGPDDSYAVIQDLDSREQDLFETGDFVQNEAQILEITRHEVLLQRDGMRETLTLVEPDARTRAGRARPVRRTQPGGGDGVRKVSRNRYLVSEGMVEQALRNPSRLMTQIRAVPHFKNGKTDGFRVFAIRQGSVFSKMGLENGDVIKRINDIEITSPSEAFRAYRELQDQRSLSVRVSRRGRERTLSYEIR